MSGSVTFVDGGVRKLMAEMIAESEGKRSNPYVTKYLRYKKGTLADPWREQGITDADGVHTRWPSQNEDYVIEKFKLRSRRMWTSPYGKPIQAPWDYSVGAMTKAPKIADFDKFQRVSMMEKTGLLRRSIEAKKSFTRGKIQFAITIKGAARKYGWANHYGDKNRWERFKYQTLKNGEIVERIGTPEKYQLPARPFMVWTARDINKLIETLYAWLENRFKK